MKVISHGFLWLFLFALDGFTLIGGEWVEYKGSLYTYLLVLLKLKTEILCSLVCLRVLHDRMSSMSLYVISFYWW